MGQGEVRGAPKERTFYAWRLVVPPGTVLPDLLRTSLLLLLLRRILLLRRAITDQLLRDPRVGII